MRYLKCAHFVRDAKCILDSKLNHVDNLQCVGFWIDKIFGTSVESVLLYGHGLERWTLITAVTQGTLRHYMNEGHYIQQRALWQPAYKV